MSDDEMVYLKAESRGNSSERRYHTDEDCHRLALAVNYYEKSLAVIDDDIPECMVCSGEYSPARNSHSRDMRDRLLAMDPDDVSALGGGE